jgi:phage FluMu gp28-like protein
VLHTREVLELPKMSTPDQIAKLRPRIHKVQRVCLDYTGPGVGLGDYLAKEFGEYNPDQDKFGKIELCNFSNTFKQDVFPKLKMRFEARGIRIPVSRVIREDLHAISRVVTQTGQVSYRAPHTEDGHSDRATALALCVRAGGTKAGPFAYRRVEVRRTGLRSRGVTI